MQGCGRLCWSFLQVQKAVEAGYDVRGFMYWTLIDNWEWAFAYELKFGLYEFDPTSDDPSNRRLKDGAKVSFVLAAHLQKQPVCPYSLKLRSYFA